ERPGPAHPAPLPLAEPAPDAELLAVGERVLQALVLDLTAPAHALGLPGRCPSLREEEVGIDPQAVGPLLPALRPVVGLGTHHLDELCDRRLHRQIPSE